MSKVIRTTSINHRLKIALFDIATDLYSLLTSSFRADMAACVVSILAMALLIVREIFQATQQNITPDSRLQECTTTNTGV